LDDAYVFRFACEDREHFPLEREVHFLEKLLRTGVSVPEYTHVDKYWEVAGYRPIPGESLSYETFISLTREQRRDIATSVAGVLNEVHGFSMDEASTMGIPEDDPWYVEVSGFIYNYLRIIRHGSLNEAELAYSDDIVRKMASTDLTISVPQCVIHADIEPPHVLVDNGRFTGVIDFGDILIGDPACDFGWLWELGEAFIDDVLGEYRFGSEDSKRRGYWFWFGRAMGHNAMGRTQSPGLPVVERL
jgi:aminoglycoside phosphotransferase (APT) family kinase protein